MKERVYNTIIIHLFLCIVTLGACVKSQTKQMDYNRTSKEGIHMVRHDNNHLEFKIQTDKGTYQINEAIFLRMSLVNKGEKTLLINKRFIINSQNEPKAEGTGEVYLIVKSPEGDSLVFEAFIEVGYPSNNDFQQLRPEEIIDNGQGTDIRGYYNFSAKGMYTITAYYYNYYEKGIRENPWKGEIKSNTITVRIG